MESSDVKYHGSLEALGLKNDIDPFPTSSPEEVNYWADNKDVKFKVIKAEVDSLIFSSSSLYLFWGFLGSGKTFAMRYLQSSKVTEKIVKRLKKPEVINPLFIDAVASSSKGSGGPTFSVHKQLVTEIIEKISKDEELLKALANAHKELTIGIIQSAFRDIGRRVYKPMDNKYTIENVSDSEGFKLLLTGKSKLGRADSVDDLITILVTLLKILFKKYTRVFFMIDELEVLTRTRTVAEKVLFNDFIRRLHDRCESGLTVIMIFSFDTAGEIEDTLLSGVLSRVRDVIEFNKVKNHSDLKEYILDCIKQRGKVEPTKIISEAVVDKIASELLGSSKEGLAFRDINRRMHEVFIKTYLVEGQPQRYKITDAVYSRAMDIAADQVVKDLEKELKDG